MPSTSLIRSMGGLKLGRPDGILPTVTRWPARLAIDTKATEMTTRNSAIGRLGRNLSPNHNRARLAKPMPMTTGCTWRNWLAIANTRSIKLCPPPGMPRRAGICVAAMLRPAPALKPSRTVSLMKLIKVLSRNSHATMHIAAAKCRKSRNLSIAHRITHGQGRGGNPDHKRDRGSRPNRQVAGGAK